MAGRRRKWLIAVVLLVFVAALAWALLGRGGKMEVQLVFVGYTNYTATFTSPAPASVVFSGQVFRAIVMATNSGNETVEISESWRRIFSPTYRHGYAAPLGMDAPNVLKPGQTLLVGVVPQSPLGVPWSTELMVRRRCLLDRLYAKAMARGGAVQRIVTSCSSSPPTEWATLGPITDLPPRDWTLLWAAFGLHTNSPPDK